jgi:hypothetical protein
MSETVKDRANKFYDAYAKSSGGRRVLDLLTEFGEAERTRAVEECANAYCRAYNELGQAVSTADRGLRAILALIAPPVPVWCKHCKLSDDGKVVTIYTDDGKDVIMQCFAVHIGQCPIAGCGAPKPEVAK